MDSDTALLEVCVAYDDRFFHLFNKTGLLNELMLQRMLECLIF